MLCTYLGYDAEEIIRTKLGILWARTEQHLRIHSMIRRLSWWYILSAPLLLVRVPVTWVAIYWGAELWLAVTIAWFVERPLYFWTATAIDRRLPR